MTKKAIKLNMIWMMVSLIAFMSCELDNYDMPNASLFGSIVDAETGELLEQDIINGTQIEYIELGFDDPATQYLVVKNEGTFRNNLVFAGTYTVRPVRGNFFPIDKQEIQVTGNTQIDFQVQPYIRVKNVSIAKAGDKVIATFNLEQTGPNNVRKIGLYAHPEAAVGEPLRKVAVEKVLNEPTDPNTTFSLEIDLPSHPALAPGHPYFFRVGALYDASEAKLNYAKAVRLAL